MSGDTEEIWRESFWKCVQTFEDAAQLREAASSEQLGIWTTMLTGVVVRTCRELGWIAAAKGHRLDVLPIPRNEFLSLDVVAFEHSRSGWQFPIAVLELENSLRKEQIAYSLWKVLSVRSGLRIVFCYRRSPEESGALCRYLSNEVVTALSVHERCNMPGETFVVIGSKNDSATFPYGFFKWWQLEKNTGVFRVA